MSNYSLHFKPKSVHSLNIPDVLIDPETAEKFGPNIQLTWQLILLKDEQVWERIQADEAKGIFYAELNINNLKQLTASIDLDFLHQCLNNHEHFDLIDTPTDQKYNILFSLISDRPIKGARGMAWEIVNVMAFEYRLGLWHIDNDSFWNQKKWTVIEQEQGHCEILISP